MRKPGIDEPSIMDTGNSLMHSEHTPSILIFWDIDGTLIPVGEAGEKSLNLTISDLLDKKGNLSAIDYAGRTDRLIAEMLLEHFGHEINDETSTRVIETYLDHLENTIKLYPPSPLPGIIEALEAIHNHPAAVQGLLTGNLKRGAEIKLRHFGLWKYFSFGAFSDSSKIRDEIAAHAFKVAREATGFEFTPGNTFVIGDTFHDITCGKSIGANTIAVATGRVSKEDLKTKNPDYLFSNFSEVATLLESLRLS